VNAVSSPSAPPSTVASATTRPTTARRVLRFLGRPFRFAARRPGRALLLATTLLTVVASTIAIAVVVWFHHHLRTARVEADRWHNAVAVHHLKLCRLVRPDHPEVLLLAARVARRTGAPDEAEGQLDRYATLFGDDEALVLERLLHRAANGELEAAGPILVARIERGGQEARLAREALVMGLSYRYRWREAAAILDRWLGETPDDTIGLLLLGRLLEEQRGIDVAVKTYRRILELDPENLDARLRLAMLFDANRQGAEAAEQLAVLRDRLPSHPEIHVLWVRSLALLGRTDEARAALNACLRAHPDYPPALAERGEFALLDGDERAAEADLAKAVARDPGNVTTRNQYALALARNGKRDESQREYAEVKQLQADSDRMAVLIRGPLQTTPNDPAIHHEIALIALRAGQTRECLRWFESALVADPNHLPTHRALAVLYHELDNPILAARHRALAQKLAGTAPQP